MLELVEGILEFSARLVVKSRRIHEVANITAKRDGAAALFP